MPITLNHSNIGVQYSTGSNYIIETVKSDLYLRDTRTDITSNLLAEPTVVSPVFTESIRTFTHSGGTEEQTSYTITVGQNTICDILIVGGGGGGSAGHGGGGGAGQLVLINNAILSGTYTIKVGKGGNGSTLSGTSQTMGTITNGTKGSNSEFGNASINVIAEGGGISVDTTLRNGGSGAGGDGHTPDGGVGGKGLKNTTVDTFSSGTVYSRGNDGGDGAAATSAIAGQGGGGGGAGSAGTTGGQNNDSAIGHGGDGLSGISQINYDFKTNFGNYGKLESDGNYWFAGGGAGGTYYINSSVISNGGKGGGGSTPASVAYAKINGGVGMNGTGGGGAGGTAWYGNGGNGGSGIVIIKFKSTTAISEGNPITHKRLNYTHTPSTITYDFTNYNTEATWKAYAATIPNFTYLFDSWPGGTFDPDAVWMANAAVGWFQMTLPSGYNNVSVFYGHGTWNNSSYVRLLINGVEKSRVNNIGTTTYSQTYIEGDILKVEEGFSTMTANIIITLTNTNFITNTYTLNFPVPTIADINNNSNIVLRGAYDISLSSMNSTIIPKSNQYIPKLLPLTTSNISVRYNLLNPTLDPIGAQWTYNSSNTNVYHMGNVGIGTKSPEYQLDVRGFIHTSVGGYTQTGSENWIIQSDRRIKENIVKASYEKCLENVKNIELYNFNFKDNCVNTDDRHQLGFIAQEVQQVYPKAVEVGKIILDNNQGINDLLTLNTTQIKYTLYGAVKNLIERVENIESRVEQIYNMTLSSNFKSPSSNISIRIINTSNIAVSTSNISVSTSNVSVSTSNVSVSTSNVSVSTSNISVSTSNVSVSTSNINTSKA
jgi:hypothetical protein